MLDEMKEKLELLPPLREGILTAPCKICKSPARFFDVVDFNKYCSASPFDFGYSGIPIKYFKCHNCDFIFTDVFDDWSSKEFAKYIYNSDYIKVDPQYDGSRSRDNAIMFSELLNGCQDKRILDYGSGEGGLSAGMAENGFLRVESYDPFSSPAVPEGKFDIAILVEVIEHTVWPNETMAAVADFMNPNGIILVGQSLQPDNIDEIRGYWWYLAPRNGHISTYSERTFISMAERAGLSYHRGPHLYCFVKGNPDESGRRVVDRFQPFKRLLLLTDNHLEEGTFHGQETNMLGTYQWSGGTSYRWTAPPSKDNLAVEIPFCMAINDKYAELCRMSVDGQEVLAKLAQGPLGGTLRFDLPPSTETRSIEMLMPEPISPRQMHGVPDDRPLGLALFTSANYTPAP